MNPKQRWEQALGTDKAHIFGPPAWLVMEFRKGKEDIRITRNRVREQLGMAPIGIAANEVEE